MFNLEPESSSPMLGSPDPIKAGINGMELSDGMRSSSNLEFGAESALDIEKLMPAVEQESDLLLASDGLGAASVERPPEVGKDLLTGDTEEPTAGEIDGLTGGGSDGSKIETRARKGDFAGNSRGKAYNIGELTETEVFGDVVGKSDRRDIYKFRVMEKRDVAIALDELDGNADLFLLNNKGIVLEKSVKDGKQAEEINIELEPGVYYGEVRSKGSATANYEITFEGEATEALREEGLQARSSRKRELQRTNIGTLRDYYDNWDSVNINKPDAYIFTLNKTSELDIELSGLSGNADLGLYSYKKRKWIDTSQNSGSSDEAISYDVPSGKYAVKVRTKDRWSDIDYKLEINAAPRIENIGILSGTQSFEGDVSKRDRYDLYKFTLDESKEVDISLSGLDDNANLYLAKKSGKKLKNLVKSKNSGTSDEAVSYPLRKGDYYVIVERATPSDNTDYDLVIGEMPLQSAGVLTEARTFTGSIDKHDPRDFYTFKLEKDTDVNINLSGLSDNAELLLYKSGKGLEASSGKPGSSNETISKFLPAGSYVAMIASNGETNTDYKLSLEPKVTTRTDSSPGIPYVFGQLGSQDDTLSEIAQRELNDASRWNEIMKEDGSTYTDEEARYITAGTTVYLPKDGNPADSDDSSSGNGGSNGSGNTANGYYSELSSLTDHEWEDRINSGFDLNNINNDTNSDLSKLYRDLSNDLLGKYFPMTGAFISDDYYAATRGGYGYHGGIDLGGDIFGNSVKSLVDGTVVVVDPQDGLLSVKSDDGKHYIYMHLSEFSVNNGEQINAGEIIGKAGSTAADAPHLHFEISKNPWGALQAPAAQTKEDFRAVSYNPLKEYWELRNG